MTNVTNYNFAGKKALVRVDFNVPLTNRDKSPTILASVARSPLSRRFLPMVAHSSLCRTWASPREK